MNQKYGILVISHGSQESSWVDTVEHAVEAAKRYWITQAVTEEERLLRKAVPIVSSYLELVEGRLIQDGIDVLEKEGVTKIHVMPLFVSAGSSHVEEIKQAFGYTAVSDFVGDLEPFSVQAEVIFDEPIGAEPEIIQIIKEQANELLSTTLAHKQEKAILLLGHGSTIPFFYTRWEEGIRLLTENLQEELNNNKIMYASLLPENSRATLLSMINHTDEVAIIPLFISPGYFTRTVIPKRLEGLYYNYSGKTFLPHEAMARLLARRFQSYV